MARLCRCSWRIKKPVIDLTEGDVEKDVNKKWYKRRYDILGIFGQLIGIRKLNNPKIKYCSEDVIARLRKLGCNYIDPHYNPPQLNKYMSSCSEFNYEAHWFCD